MLDYAQARRLMVDCQLRTFDVNDIAVLDAFDAVPRENFVPPGAEPFAYIDQNLKLGGSDGDLRYMPASMLLARMIQALRIGGGVRALDVGTGYGYAAAVMARLGGRVTALESDPALAEAARERLDGTQVEVVEGPLAAGLPKAGPYDAILINGRVEVRPQALLDQLKDEGRLVCVLGRDKSAKATLFVRAGDAFGARPLFDAALPGLAAFREEAGFAF
ncbi:protein-L-isoaspartate O-methyltransferase [Methylobacterium sp. E-041]|uniref:protein-L-isoaspartate O-methyltransferase family protein n=1 Tax=unclassified Methylobacterium TaxID=2615210 RepID=UPI0011CA41B7|nr:MULTISPECIES: protein-L-isoaspartate O-methyltransferase [unclassified Methylobacterium]MCJ2010016.1 protein-L-isoaspartate O-methyltransferase [Methylobacterium sp. J-092]MCJ2104266.1 protein-L-isoaspartate O-methyltransferase [Methylobacterium sp. E-041]MCJ2114459.1 protein-L-isoaspartate O-methyltransferase [Methylobacterium sp. E-025]TXM87284.1 protein-L-isoaspartate O-methyltransferase [Methylobacterium sp. WL116]TXN21499.1 protein-L-isoaspartate O-methyltransferase [Methylobacterium s